MDKQYLQQIYVQKFYLFSIFYKINIVYHLIIKIEFEEMKSKPSKNQYLGSKYNKLANINEQQLNMLQANSFYKQKLQILDNIQKQQFTQSFSVEYLESQKHFCISSDKIYLIFGQAYLLYPITIKQSYNYQSPQKKAQFQQKYIKSIYSEKSKNDYFDKKIEMLYNEFEVIKRFEKQDTFGQGEFFEGIYNRSEILIAKNNLFYFVLDKKKLSQKLYNKMYKLFTEKIKFLSAFDWISNTKKIDFYTKISQFSYFRFKFNQIIYNQTNKSAHIYFLKNGQIEISVQTPEQKLKIYKIQSANIFGEDKSNQIAQVVSQYAQVYAISQLNYYKNKQKKQGENYKNFTSNIKNFNNDLKMKAKDYYKIIFEKKNLKPLNESTFIASMTNVVKRAFKNNYIFTNQFNLLVKFNEDRKNSILKKLNYNKNYNTTLYEYVPIKKTMPDMTQLKNQFESRRSAQYKKLIQTEKQNLIVTRYNKLVNEGLEPQLKLPKFNLTKAKQQKNIQNLSPNLWFLIKKYNK